MQACTQKVKQNITAVRTIYSATHARTTQPQASQPASQLTHPGVADLHELLAVHIDGLHDGVRVVLDQPIIALLLHLNNSQQAAFRR